MNRSENLYPIIFKPILKPIIWGGTGISKFKNIEIHNKKIGESWEISNVKDNISIVENGSLTNSSLENLIKEYKERLVGNTVYNKFGETFPLLFKFIDATDDLSIQVHPDDKLAKERHDSFGKTEMWYVVKAKEGAYLYSGFEKNITPEQYIETVKDGTFTDSLMKHFVKEGDVFFLPAGRVHAIGSGCFIAEIQQTSNITYRIFDYNRKDENGNQRELHAELAKDAIDFKVYDSYKTEYKTNPNTPVELVTCPYFTTNLVEIEKTLTRDFTNLDSFVVYMCLQGNCTITDNNGYSVEVEKGKSILIPAETKNLTIKTSEYTKLLETYVR